MNEKSKGIKLIGPPHWYKDDEENIGEISVKPPCRCGECGNPAPEKQKISLKTREMFATRFLTCPVYGRARMSPRCFFCPNKLK